MHEDIWTAQKNYYPMLRERMVQEHLLVRRPTVSILQLVLGLLLVSLSIVVSFLFPHPFIIILAATFCGYATLLLGYVVHDNAHHQSSKKERTNNIIGFIAASVLGLSYLNWRDVHNAHHESPNHEDDDPDVSLPFLAFSPHQVEGVKRAPYLWFIRFQTLLYIPLLSLIPYSKRYTALQNLFFERKRSALSILDTSIILSWHLVNYGGLWLLLGFWPMILFSVIQQAALGVFFGMVFAPNHKGMPMLTEEDNLDFFTQQVITARNVRLHPWIAFTFGGLNYQIEHHLFPNMPRYNLAKSAVITKQFCSEHQIPYHETSFAESYAEIRRSLKEAADHAKALSRSRKVLDESDPLADLQLQLKNAIQSAKIELGFIVEAAIERGIETSHMMDLQDAYDSASHRLSEIQTSIAKASDLKMQNLANYKQEVQDLVQRVQQVRA